MPINQNEEGDYYEGQVDNTTNATESTHNYDSVGEEDIVMLTGDINIMLPDSITP